MYKGFSSSTRDCAISRTPGQHILFEQQLSDFKVRHPHLPVVVIFAPTNPTKVIADMARQLVLLSELFGRQMVFVAIGINDKEADEDASQMLETTAALHEAHVMHRVQHTSNLEGWTRQALLGYMNDFEAAIVLRGVICATDLARLFMHSIDNRADVTCSVDVSFSPHHLIASNPFNLDGSSGKNIPTETLLRSRSFIQARCCDSSAKVVSFRALRPGLFPRCSEEGACSEDISGNVDCDPRYGECNSPARIMISPSVKSSRDPDDFRSAIQLGFTDLQGFDYKEIEWKEIKARGKCAGSI